MRVKVLSVVPIVNASGPEMTRSETVTIFNDMCVLAPAALIEASIDWDTLDDRTVRGTFTRLGETVAATLVFGDDGLLVDFVSDDRYRSTSDRSTFERQRWSTPLSDYRPMDGRLVCTHGEDVASPSAPNRTSPTSSSSSRTSATTSRHQPDAPAIEHGGSVGPLSRSDLGNGVDTPSLRLSAWRSQQSSSGSTIAAVRANPSASVVTISSGLVAVREAQAWLDAQHAGLVAQLRQVDSFPEKTIADAAKSSLGRASKTTERSATLRCDTWLGGGIG